MRKGVNVSIRTSVVAEVEADTRSINFLATKVAAGYSQGYFQVKEEFRVDGFINQLAPVKNKIRNNIIYSPVTVLRTNVIKMEYKPV
jgi:hypothetical protein